MRYESGLTSLTAQRTILAAHSMSVSPALLRWPNLLSLGSGRLSTVCLLCAVRSAGLPSGGAVC